MDLTRIEIRTSQIKSAGDGIFAKTDIPSGELICEYIGDLVDGGDNLSSDQSDVAINVGGGLAVVGNGIGAKINDIVKVGPITEEEFDLILASETFPVHDGHIINCAFEIKGSGEFAIVNIVSIRDIQAGEELFISYGYNYWIDRFIRWGMLDRDYAKKATTAHIWQKMSLSKQNKQLK